MKPKFKTEYWTLFHYGDSEVICSKHRTVLAAERARRKCERNGGANHRVIEVKTIIPYK